MIDMTCPECGANISEPNAAAGSRVQCRSCRAVVPGPRGRGPVVWFLVGLGVLLLAGVGIAAAIIIPRLREPAWQTHDSAAGGFRIEFPGPPEDMAGQIGVRNVPGFAATGTSHRGLQYVVAWGDIQNREFRTDQQIIEDAFRGSLAQGTPTTSERSAPFTVGGFPARDLELAFDDGEAGLIRVVVADTRVYVVTFGGPGGKPSNAFARRFFDSFAITDPKLADGVPYAERKARERKAAEEKRAQEAKAAAEKRAEEERAAEARFLAPNPPAGTLPDPKTVPGLVALLSFDGDDPATDAVTGQSGGTVRGGATVGPGARGKALYAVAPGAGMDLDPLLNRLRFWPQQSFTVAGWYKLRPERPTVNQYGSPAPAQHGGVFTAEDFPGRRAELVFRPGAAWQIADAWGPDQPYYHKAISLAESPDKPKLDGKWHHFALVRDSSPTGEVLTLYLDGKWFPPRHYGEHHAAADLTRLARAYLGDAPDAKPGAAALVGAIDEFCVFARALPGWEVRSLAGIETPGGLKVRPESPAHLPGVAFHLPMLSVGSQATTYETLTRVAPAAPHGSAVAAKNARVESPRNEGLEFTFAGKLQWTPGWGVGAGEAARRFGVGPYKPFTAVAWVRVPDGQTESLGVWRASGLNWFGVQVADGTAEVVLSECPHDKRNVYNSPPPLGAVRLKRADAPKGRWYHVAVTRSEAGEVRLWFDGSEGEKPTRTEYTGGIDLNLGLGFAVLDRPSDDRAVNVSLALDEFALFERVLTEDELLALAGRKPPPPKLTPPPLGFPPTTLPPRKPPVPPADQSEIDGLRFHLSCEELKGNAVKDEVAGKFAGGGYELSLVPGVRGKALRVPGSDSYNPAAVQRGYEVLCPPVKEDAAFTLSVWTRWPDAEPAKQLVAFSTSLKNLGDRTRPERSRLDRSIKGSSLEVVSFPDRENPEARETAAGAVGDDGKLRDWYHVAVARDGKGAVRVYENGKAVQLEPRLARGLSALTFDQLWLGQGRGGYQAEVDEVCLFGRELSEDEVKALAGQKELPKK